MHSILAEYVDIQPSMPHLHLGQNTLPNPPFPLPTGIYFGDLTEGWCECDQDIATFLREGVDALRRQPIPDISAFTEEIRLLQRVLRFDSIVMAWRDAEHPAFSLVALAVDRAGNFLAGRVPDSGTEADIEVTEEAPDARDKAFLGLLHELLQAQYDWTTTTFGLVQ